MARTEYSDEFKAATVALVNAMGGNTATTADQLGIPESTVRSWAKGVGNKGVPAQLHEEKKQELIERLNEVAWKLAGGLLDEHKIKDASIQQVATAFGIIVDKMRLLSGESTEITEHREVDHLRADIQRRLISVAPQNGTRAQA